MVCGRLKDVIIMAGRKIYPTEIERARPPGSAHEVFAEVDMRPRNMVVLEPGMIPKTPSGKLRRAHALTLVS